MASSEAAARRWRQVEEIFRAAVELPAAERREFLDAACGSDTALRRELDELLAADGAKGDFIAAAVEAGEELLLRQARALPPRFGKYEVEGRLGEGGFGVVYRGRDPLLDRPVAIKACSRSDEGLRRRFYREARIAAGLRHANITTVHELGVEDGVPFLVQELLEGEDLRQVIRQGRRLSLATVVAYLVQIARGLEHAHAAGVLHRDVKPANVRILPDGSVKLMDFGIAKVLGTDTGLTGTGMTLGTVGYLAPEQLRSEEADERADIFAFGVLAYELLTGERPFRGDDFSQVSYQLLYTEPPSLTRASLARTATLCPEPLALWVHRCLAKERGRRPGSMTAVRVALEELAGRIDAGGGGGLAADEASGVLPPTSGAPAASLSKTGRRPWVAALMAGLAVLGVLWLGSRRAGQPSELEQPGAWSSQPAAMPLTASSPPERSLPIDAAEDPQTGDLNARPLAGQLASLAPPTAGRAREPAASAGSPTVGDNGSPAAADGASEEDVAPALASIEAPQEVPQGSPLELLKDNSQETPQGTVPLQGAMTVPSLSAPAVDLAVDLAADLAADSKSDPLSAAGPQGPPAAAPEPDRGSVEASAPLRVAQQPSPPVRSLDAVSEGEAAPPTVGEETPSTMRRGELITGPGPGVEGPRLLRRPQPEYPSRALRRGIAGQVVVKVLVDEDGHVLQAIAPGSDQHGFLAAARRAAQGAAFEPARRDGVAGRMWINLSFDFTPQPTP